MFWCVCVCVCACVHDDAGAGCRGGGGRVGTVLFWSLSVCVFGVSCRLSVQFHLVEGLVHIRMFTQRSCHSAGQADHGDTASTLHLWLLDTFAGCIPVVTFCLLVLSCICQLCMLDSVVRMRLWFYRLFVGLVLNLTTLCLGQCC